jgi:sigma-E factor negative regulatory protein RseB
MRLTLIALLGAAAVAVAHAAEGGSQSDALTWLKKMAAASRQLNYSGTIVYHHGNEVETSRIVHYVNAAGGEFEKLEALDGPPREVIRSNDQVVCYLPSSKTVLIEERSGNARPFPAIIPGNLTGITENYDVQMGKSDRVAGFECQWIALVPRDTLRYGRRFCAELGTALPLRAITLNEKSERLESFAFTQLTLGGSFSRERVRSKYADIARAQNWRIERSALSMPAAPGATGWVLNAPLPGFHKLMEGQRSMGGRSGYVPQIVFSDGLAAISVFVEANPRAAQPNPPPLAHQGAVNIYTRAQGRHLITALGEAPAATIMQLVDSLEFRPRAATVQQ